MRTRKRRIPPRALLALVAFGLTALVGCLDEPTIDETWTKLEFLSVTPGPKQSPSASQPINVRVQGRVTYRSILTGFLVAEVRYSPTIAPSSVLLNPDEHTLKDAESIDRILANSVTAGRATRASTGFDHLMQDVDLNFAATIPAGYMPGTGGLYLLLYMGDGEEVERVNNTDTLIVTPFVSTQKEVLHTGFAINITP
ncbi:MAG TPA: hypothetical protein VFH33_00490 [Candidatus Krumholzibacteria bacterium]|nr:hypothetical protein [Candidatus Krumholzibacteria bacterium]